MEQQLVRIGDVLDIEQFDRRVFLGIEVLVHVLQHILDAYLFAIADRPYAVELQALDDGTLQYEYCRSSRAADEVDALGVQYRNRFGEYRMVMARQQSDAVGTDECGTILLARVQNALLHLGTRLGLFAEACRDDDKGPCLLLLSQIFHGIGAQLGRNDQYSQFRRRQLAGIVENLDALHLVLLGVDDA